MKKVATLGEILMRLATPNKERILQAKNLMLITVEGSIMLLFHYLNLGFQPNS